MEVLGIVAVLETFQFNSVSMVKPDFARMRTMPALSRAQAWIGRPGLPVKEENIEKSENREKR